MILNSGWVLNPVSDVLGFLLWSLSSTSCLLSTITKIQGLRHSSKILNRLEIKMTEKEDSRLTFSHEHIKTTTIAEFC